MSFQYVNDFAAAIFGVPPAKPGSMGMFSASPARDAEEHFDAMTDTIDTEVDYLGITFYVEVNRHSRNCSEITRVSDGSCWYYEFSGMARRNIAALAIEGTQS